jgi:DNA-binding transcriptional MerR regulator
MGPLVTGGSSLKVLEAMMTKATLSIGDLSRQTGCKVPTIRWYEQVGLLSAPARTSGGQRAYGHGHLERLDFIRHAREFGFPLDAIRSLLDLTDKGDQSSCEAAHQIASAQLASVENKLKRLQALQTELAHMVKTGCRGTPADCRILATLADHDHGHCLTDAHADEAQFIHGPEISRGL